MYRAVRQQPGHSQGELRVWLCLQTCAQQKINLLQYLLLPEDCLKYLAQIKYYQQELHS